MKYRPSRFEVRVVLEVLERQSGGRLYQIWWPVFYWAAAGIMRLDIMNESTGGALKPDANRAAAHRGAVVLAVPGPMPSLNVGIPPYFGFVYVVCEYFQPHFGSDA